MVLRPFGRLWSLTAAGPGSLGIVHQARVSLVHIRVNCNIRITDKTTNANYFANNNIGDLIERIFAQVSTVKRVCLCTCYISIG